MKTYRSRKNLVRIYLSNEEKEILDNLCNKYNLSMSKLIRELIIENQE
ncbi:ribbon-helix-helix protein, CopG family [Clostridium disporicum]|uniref:Ribbon-helix-helix protein, copG family n=1 Tax=Clostridium disporicum TaxID=84024 RepID=A0A174DR59_9CLOT|nr:ribbon-helix-helix protein, CopG family [Clostridium disporicum]CUO26749.1 Ribbon-helix-helix protein%2C copG family [Clostridium disporicum]